MNWRAWLKLSRIGGITSALGTGQAGLYLGSAGADLRQIPMVLSASASLYLFGMVSNDVLDREKDATFRPERPIPSGVISLNHASMAIVIIVLLMFLISLGLEERQRLFFVASAIAILLYNGPCKSRWWLATFVIASARACNFLMGCGPMDLDTTWLLPTMAIALHTVTIMVLAEGEDRDTPLPQWIWGINALSALCVSCLPLGFPHAVGAALLWFGFTSWIIWQFRSESRKVRPRLIGAMVGAFTLLDASYLFALGANRLAGGFIVIHLVGKTLSRRFPPG